MLTTLRRTGLVASIGVLASACSFTTVTAGPAVSKAVGGEVAASGSYPFQVALLLTKAYDGNDHLEDEPLRALGCAGTLLGGPWVLTAAHCVSYRSFDYTQSNEFPPRGCLPQPDGVLCIYRPGAFAVLAKTQELLPGKGQRFTIKRIIVNDGYREAANEHDIALLELTEIVPSPGSMLIADEAFTAAAEKTGRLARAVGWGLIDEDYGPNSVSLREIDIPVQPLDRCRERHKLYQAWVGKVAWQDLDPENAVTTNMVCIGWDEPPPSRNGKPFTGSALPNVCFGDSGGFVGLKDAEGHWVQIGTPSWQKDCKTPYIYSVETNVAKYRDWIRRETGLTLPLPK